MMIEKYFGIEREMAQQLIDTTRGMVSEKSGNNDFQSTKVFLFDEYAVLKMQNINFRNVTTQDTDLKHLERLAKTLLDLQAEGVNVVPILAFQSNGGDSYIIQPRAKGAELYDRDKLSDKDYVLRRVESLSKAPQRHFGKFVADTIKIIDAGVMVDFVGKDNFFYDEVVGFQFIDLNAHNDYEYGLADAKPQGKQIAARRCFLLLMSELTGEECGLIKECNGVIFEKCRNAMLSNEIFV